MGRKSPQIVGGGIVAVVAAEEKSCVAAVVSNACMARDVARGRSTGRDALPRRKRNPSSDVYQDREAKQRMRSYKICKERSHDILLLRYPRGACKFSQDKRFKTRDISVM